VDPSFPLELWDELSPQLTITLNLLSKSWINPRMSAYAQLNGLFYFNRTHMAPPGTRIIAHEKQNQTNGPLGILTVPGPITGSLQMLPSPHHKNKRDGNS
jgi:hypothetical protein